MMLSEYYCNILIKLSLNRKKIFIKNMNLFEIWNST